MKGFFITFEGLDGCGKTTQFNKTAEYIKQVGRETLITREPGGTRLGEKIRELLLDIENTGMSNIAELMLYAAARAELVSNVILPSLNEGKIVLCDRFLDSSIAYQGFGRELGEELVLGINKYALQECKPDLTIFFDISPSEISKRGILEKNQDRVEAEEMDFHERVYQGYLKIAKREKERFIIIDARRTIDEIFADLKIIIEKLINT